MKKQTFTRKEVIDLIDNLLTHADAVMDSITNENTDFNGEALLEISEQTIQSQDTKNK